MLKVNFSKKMNTVQGRKTLQAAFEIKENEILSLFGESGQGKTTILRCLAGLTIPDSGSIVYKDQIWFNSQKKIFVRPQQRNLGLVFQDYALFPNMTVRQNLVYAAAKLDKEKKEWIEELLTFADLKQLEQRRPHQLSGGQKQRVALLRSLVQRPKILLLDEPFSSLDMHMRARLHQELQKIAARFELSLVLVTHELSDIFRLAHRVITIKNHCVYKSGTLREVFFQDRFSGKFKFSAEVLQIEKEDTANIVTLLIGNTPVKILVSSEEAQSYSVGDQVLVGTKAFQPMLLKKL